jgi:hypothetical protein
MNKKLKALLASAPLIAGAEAAHAADGYCFVYSGWAYQLQDGTYHKIPNQYTMDTMGWGGNHSCPKFDNSFFSSLRAGDDVPEALAPLVENHVYQIGGGLFSYSSGKIHWIPDPLTHWLSFGGRNDTGEKIPGNTNAKIDANLLNKYLQNQRGSDVPNYLSSAHDCQKLWSENHYFLIRGGVLKHYSSGDWVAISAAAGEKGGSMNPSGGRGLSDALFAAANGKGDVGIEDIRACGNNEPIRLTEGHCYTIGGLGLQWSNGSLHGIPSQFTAAAKGCGDGGNDNIVGTNVKAKAFLSLAPRGSDYPAVEASCTLYDNGSTSWFIGKDNSVKHITETLNDAKFSATMGKFNMVSLGGGFRYSAPDSDIGGAMLPCVTNGGSIARPSGGTNLTTGSSASGSTGTTTRTTASAPPTPKPSATVTPRNRDDDGEKKGKGKKR